MMQQLVQIIIALIVAGFILWALRQLIGLIPMDPWLKQVVEVLLWIIVVAIVLFYVIIPLIHMLASQVHL